MYKHLALAAAVSAVFSLQASAAGTQLTVYTALEAEQLKSYKQAFEKANPDIEIKYNKVELSLSTHSEGGVTEKDFDLAAKIDAASSAS